MMGAERDQDYDQEALRPSEGKTNAHTLFPTTTLAALKVLLQRVVILWSLRVGICLFCFMIGSYYVSPAGPELIIYTKLASNADLNCHLPPEYRDYRCKPPHLTLVGFTHRPSAHALPVGRSQDCVTGRNAVCRGGVGNSGDLRVSGSLPLSFLRGKASLGCLRVPDKKRARLQ